MFDVLPQRQLDLGPASWFRVEANTVPDNKANVTAGWAHVGAQSVVDRFTAGDQQTGVFAVVAVGFERWDLVTLDSTGAPVITQGTAFASPAPLYKGAPGNSFGPDAPDQFPLAYVHVTEPVTVVVTTVDVTPVLGLVELRRVLEGHRIDKGATGGAPAGTSTVVTALFVGETSGGSATARGVVTVAPDNLVRILDQNYARIIRSADRAEIFGRLTYAVGVWTLTYRYIDATGVEVTVGSIATDPIVAPTNIRLVSVPKVFSKDETTRPAFDNTSLPPVSDASTTVGPAFGGDGSLGSITFAASTTINGVFNYANVTINAAVIVDTTFNRALTLRGKGNFSNSGTLTAAGRAYTSGTGAAGGQPQDTPGAAGSAATQGEPYATGGGGGSGGANGGSSPGAQAGGAGGAGRTSFYDGVTAPGGAPSGTAGTTPVTPTPDQDWMADVVPPLGLAPNVVGLPGGGGGGGGAGGSTTSGDAMGGLGASGATGGRGGGIIVLEINGNLIEGTISVNGAVGAAGGTGLGNAGAGAGGGGGGGGRLVIGYTGTRTAGTTTAAGGAGGAGGAIGSGAGGTGGAGGAGRAGRVTTVKMS